MNLRRSIISVAAGFAILGSQAFAQSAAVSSDEITTVSAFNSICYMRLPDVRSIGQMASEFAWQPMDKAELSAFENGARLDVLDGWDALIGERIYRVAVTQGALLESQMALFPDLGDGTASSCTMVLDGLDDAASLAADMQALAGKAPISKDVQEGELATTTWAGGNDDIKVFLVSSLGGEKGGFLSVTVLTR